MDAEEFFADGWPAVAATLRAALARAGVPVADREDLLQETAIRLLGMWDRVDWDRSVEPLARTIALNLWRDQWRKTGRRELVGDVVEQVSANDTERAALARVQVGEVSRALSSLSSKNASVLRLAAAEAESGRLDGAVTSALRMARSRARRALLACVQVASAVVVGVWVSARALTRAATPAAALGAMATIACLLTLVVVPPGQAGLSAGDRSTAAPAGTSLAGAHGRSAGAASPRAARRLDASHRRPVATPTPYYVIDAGSAGQVSAFFDVRAFGRGGQVRDPRSGSPAPLCVYGGSPGSVVPAC